MPPAQKYEKVPTSTERDDDEDSGGDLGIVNRTLEVPASTDRTPASSDRIMAISNLPSTHSSQQLMGGDSESVTASTLDGRDASNASLDTLKRPSSRTSHQYDGFSSITMQEWFTVGVLCFVNLINYMDRFTIAGKSDLPFPVIVVHIECLRRHSFPSLFLLLLYCFCYGDNDGDRRNNYCVLSFVFWILWKM